MIDCYGFRGTIVDRRSSLCLLYSLHIIGILKDMSEASQLYKNLPIRFYTETNYY